MHAEHTVLMNGTLKSYVTDCSTSVVVFFVFHVKCFKKDILIRGYNSSRIPWVSCGTHICTILSSYIWRIRDAPCVQTSKQITEKRVLLIFCKSPLIFFPLFLNTLSFRFLCALLLTIWSSKCNSVWSSQLLLPTSKKCLHILQENYFPLFHRVLYFSLMSGWIERSVPACKSHRLQRFACCFSKE